MACSFSSESCYKLEVWRFKVHFLTSFVKTASPWNPHSSLCLDHMIFTSRSSDKVMELAWICRCSTSFCWRSFDKPETSRAATKWTLWWDYVEKNVILYSRIFLHLEDIKCIMGFVGPTVAFFGAYINWPIIRTRNQGDESQTKGR